MWIAELTIADPSRLVLRRCSVDRLDSLKVRVVPVRPPAVDVDPVDLLGKLCLSARLAVERLGRPETLVDEPLLGPDVVSFGGRALEGNDAEQEWPDNFAQRRLESLGKGMQVVRQRRVGKRTVKGG